MKIDDNLITKINLYLEKQLDEKSHKDFEDSINKNPELSELVSTLKKMETIYDDDSWSFINDTDLIKESLNTIKSEDVRRFSEKVNAIKLERTKPKRAPKYIISIAASLLLIFGLFQFLNKPISFDEAYNTFYSTDDLPSFTLKNDIANNLVKAEQLFKSEHYNEALNLFKETTLTANAFNPKTTIYIALCHLELKDYDAALSQLDILENSNTLDYHKAYWFKVIIYLKQKKTDQTHYYLNIIKSDTSLYNYEKAKKLHKKLIKD